jgi:hypothetical protein
LDLKTAPHSQTVSISVGIGGSDCRPSLSRIIAVGKAEGSVRMDRTTEVMNRKSKSMFLFALSQKPGTRKRVDMSAKIAVKKPAQSADLTVFQPGFENGPITNPMISHDRKYRMTNIGVSDSNKVL